MIRKVGPILERGTKFIPRSEVLKSAVGKRAFDPVNGIIFTEMMIVPTVI